MARRPRTAVATATARQGGRPRICLRHILRRALALGGGFVDGLLLRPLRGLWRALPPSFRSKNARRARATAARARRAIDEALLRGGRALDSLHGALASLHRALASLHRALSPSRLLRALRRLLLPPPPPPPPLPEQQQQDPPQEEQQEPPQEQQQEPPQEEQQQPPAPQAGAWIYGRLPPRSTAAATATSQNQPRTYTVDGVEVPEGVVKEYVNYCSKASICPASCTVCHLCVFEEKRSDNYIVRTSTMFLHCGRHGHKGVRCSEPGCSVRVRAGRDQALHSHFCHRLSPDWWKD